MYNISGSSGSGSSESKVNGVNVYNISGSGSSESKVNGVNVYVSES